MGWNTQSDNSSTNVQVSTDSSRDRAQTDFIISDKSDKSGHQHVAIDDKGNTVYDSWNNKK